MDKRLYSFLGTKSSSDSKDKAVGTYSFSAPMVLGHGMTILNLWLSSQFLFKYWNNENELMENIKKNCYRHPGYLDLWIVCRRETFWPIREEESWQREPSSGKIWKLLLGKLQKTLF